ncbi:hypothetical protein D9757_014431 [Collybiopsis confluens]|uniref:Ubiquitin-like protease family profile domain-containing protein n=1 Tax=Collybiopsis confluens TaxID=2823264 RepID=A0A8H5GJD5_9AGAR|nr:hypothetical protein D9757_014431 [Collybiopsis confluens]
MEGIDIGEIKRMMDVEMNFKEWLETAILQEASQALSTAAALWPKIIFQLKHHCAPPSDHIALVVLGNLETLHDTTVKKMVGMEGFLWQEFDGHPEQAAGKLIVLVNQSTISSSKFNGHLAFIKYQDFSTLSTGRWVNNEVVNYFVDKWCTKSSTTLRLNSFFARQYLFDKVTGCPKTGVLMVEDWVSVLRWCHKTAVKQSLQDWDSMFIPINEMGTHWYLACIDFLQKRIDIYNSLREQFISNHKKPLLLQKNVNLMYYYGSQKFSVNFAVKQLTSRIMGMADGSLIPTSRSISSPTVMTVGFISFGTCGMSWNSDRSNLGTASQVTSGLPMTWSVNA